MPLWSKFTLFPKYSEDKILFKYSQVESHMKGKSLYILKMATILTSIYIVQKLWNKASVFNKNAQKWHIKLVSKKITQLQFELNQKSALYIL